MNYLDILPNDVMKIGLNQVLIPLDFGRAGCCGIYKLLKIVIMTLKEDSIYNFNLNII